MIGLSTLSWAQKVEYKNNTITVDKVAVGKVEVEKENFGLTKNFNLLSMSGEKLVVAVLSTEFESDKSDNTNIYYRFTFLPTNQTGIFKLSVLSMEKGFVNLIGKSQIIDGDTLNPEKVDQFIASKSVTPKIAVNYTLVSRSKTWPVRLTEEKKVEQNNVEIGFFVPKMKTKTSSSYEFFLPSGILVAKVNFTGGNNAQNFEVFTPKNNQTRIASIPQKEVIKYSSSAIDENEMTLKRIAKWLVDNGFL